MSRVSCWLFCSFVFAVNWAVHGFPKPWLALITVLLIGAPSLMHYGTNPRTQP